MSVSCVYSYIFEKIQVYLVVHEYKHETPLKKEKKTHTQSHAADSGRPHLSRFVCTDLQRRRWWECSVPFPLLLAKVYFTPLLSRVRGPPPHHLLPPCPGPSVRCGNPHSSNTWEINQTLLTAAYSEAGGWGITWNERYSWQVFSREIEGRKWGMGGGVLFFESWSSFCFKRTQIE